MSWFFGRRLVGLPTEWLRLTLSVLLALTALLVDEAASDCSMDDDQCEFRLDISHGLTMMHDRKAVYPHNGHLYLYNVPEHLTNQTDPVNPDDVVVADGWETQKLVVVTNGGMPGPSIEVYEGQTVVVHVTNSMRASAVTIHWHGLHQSGTPWMDGVAFVTQCPIEPGQTFTYRFKAYPKGTFWYHSHIGSELGMGLVGAFIIREKKPLPMPEHIMVLQDWNHDWDANEAHLRVLYGSFRNRKKILTTDSLEGGHFSNFLFQSGLINGRGRYLEEASTSNSTPLTVFNVVEGQSYRFRVIGAGNMYPFRVSVDDHPITLIASDGFDLEPQIFESFVIHPGERYDFTLTANQSVANYWIRAETLEVNVKNHIALAILRYNGSANDDPMTERKQCSVNDTCQVANCPFLYYPFGHHTECSTFGDLKATENHRTPGATEGLDEEIEEVFLNFAFPGNTSFPGSVNGIQFKKPPSPLLTQPKDIKTYCKADDNCGEQKQCHCTFSLELKHGIVYQMIMTNLGKGKGWPHPIHMHGHSFTVVKMGYPPYNTTTGQLLGDPVTLDNPDVHCPGASDPTQSFCNSPRWANASWGGNDVPGLELDRPPIKDTLIVPTGGYAVIRIRADNPGVWLMHCHVELHNLDGMRMVINESFERHEEPPAGFPKCGDFSYDIPDKTDPVPATGGNDDDDDDDNCIGDDVFWAVVGCLIAACVFQLIIIICLWQNSERRKSEEPRQSPAPAPDSSKDGAFQNPAFEET